MKEVGLSQVVALWEFGVLLASTNYIPSNNSVLGICSVLFFHTNRMVVGFPPLCLGMPLVYAYAIDTFSIAILHVCFLIVAFWNCFEAEA
jgi:hypothetical protein